MPNAIRRSIFLIATSRLYRETRSICIQDRDSSARKVGPGERVPCLLPLPFYNGRHTPWGDVHTSYGSGYHPAGNVIQPGTIFRLSRDPEIPTYTTGLVYGQRMPGTFR